MARVFFAGVGMGAWLLGWSGCRAPRVARDFQDGVRNHPDRAAIIRRFPGYPAAGPQGEYSAVAGVLTYWDGKTLPSDVEAAADRARARDESFESCLMNLAAERGLWVYDHALPLDALKRSIRRDLPVMVALQTVPLDRQSRRFVVATGFDDARECLLVHDGQPNFSLWAYSDFLKKWSGQRFATVTVCPPYQPDWPLLEDERLSRALYFETTGDFEAATADYEAVLKENSRSGAALLGMGNICRAQGKAAQAENWYRQALAADSLNARAYNNLAYLLAEENRNADEAVQAARQAVALDPSNPLALDTLGFALTQADKLTEAAAVLERARSRAQRYPLAIRSAIGIRLALVHLRAGHEHLAREVTADVLRQDPKAELPDPLRRFAP